MPELAHDTSDSIVKYRADDVTILLCSYNHEAYVEDALNSIVNQTIGRPRLVFIDDFSTDNTVHVAQAWLNEHNYEATIVTHRRNMGVCRSFNDGLACTQTDFVSIMSADDWMSLDRLERQLDCFVDVPDDVGVVYSDASYANTDGTPREGSFLGDRLGSRPRPEGNILSDLIEGCFLAPHALLVRSNVFDKVGLFDETLIAEDHDMWMRMTDYCNFHYLDAQVVTYRDSPDSLTKIIYRDQRQELLLDGISSLARHLGKSRDLDRKIIKQIRFYILSSYLDGGSPQRLHRRMWLVFRRSPSLINISYLLAMALRVPGRWILAIRNRASKTRSSGNNSKA